MKNHLISRVLTVLLAGTLALVPAGCVAATHAASKSETSEDSNKGTEAKEAADSKSETKAKDSKDSKSAAPAALLDLTEDGNIIATFDKTDKKTGGISGITIVDGEYLVIETALKKGKVRVKVVKGGTDIEKAPVEDKDTPATIDYTFDGTGTTEYMEIKPADYMISVTVEEKATGTILISKKSKTGAGTTAVAAAAATTAVEGSTSGAMAAAAAPKTSPEMYFGSWVTGDYLLNIGKSEEGLYACVYLQPKGQTTEWIYNEVFFDEVADEMNTLETGIKTRYIWAANGEIENVEEDYDDGATAFRLTEDGKLIWVDYKETPGKNEITFEKSKKPIAAPALLE